MIETVTIPSISILTRVGNTLTILTKYLSLLPYTIIAYLADIVGIDNSTPFIEGELVIEISDGSQVDFILNSNGDLIVIGDDANNYSIDSNGNLIYTY